MIKILLFTIISKSIQIPTTLYEITTRPYLYSLGKKLNKQCTIRDIPEQEFDDWKNKGFEWVWFMGIWELGPNSLKIAQEDAGCIQGYNENCPGWTNEDIIGSPYSIVRYSVNPAVGTLDDIKWVRDQLNKRGIKLMLDFVPNHSAWEASEIKTNKNFYIYTNHFPLQDKTRYSNAGIAYGKEYESTSWTDCAQFNYFDRGLRDHQIGVLKFIASIADGVRCDMSHCVINKIFERCWEKELKELGYATPSTEFWKEATTAVKADYPNFIFLGECYHDTEQTLVDLGFNYVYDKIPYDKLRDKEVTNFVDQVLRRSAEVKSHSCFFTENHDENRAVKTFGGYTQANAAAACLLTLPGMRFINTFQWEGPRNKIDVHLRRANSEEPNSECIHFYNKLFELLKRKSMKYGEFSQLYVDGSSTIPAWSYSYGEEHILITVNYGDNRSSGWVRLPYAPNGEIILLKEILTESTFYRNGDETRNKGLFVVLEPYQVQIYKY